MSEMRKQEAAEFRFRTRPVVDADYRPDIEYWGASSGVISPGRIARAVFGNELDFGRLFAYCFRRFGHPNTGSDNYKELANYLVTTPIEGLFLSIQIKPHNDPVLLFGYLLTQELQETLTREHNEIGDAWRAKFKDWRVSQGITLPRDKPGYDYTKHHLDDYAQYQAALSKYIAIGGTPMEDAPESTTTYAVNAAIKATLEDLKTPVGVRDVLFSATESSVELPPQEGDVEDDDGDDPRVVSHHQSAGYYVPSEYLEKPERFCLLHEKLTELGGGSLDKGLDVFVQKPRATKKARP